MLNLDLHRTIFVNILREIYADPLLRSQLGFKGGTAAMFFYHLPRFSVDLDLDLLEPAAQAVVLERLKAMLPKYGTLLEAADKHYTLFFLLDYKKGERNLKIEISKRPVQSEFVPKHYLGITMLVMSQADMSACKLAALLTRKRFAIRDVFDLWFFLKSQWPINSSLLEQKAELSLKKALKEAIKRVGTIKKTELLSGLGELIDARQKAWVRDHLIDDTTFYLRLYLDNLERSKGVNLL